jgi:uncharacterized membrane protein
VLVLCALAVSIYLSSVSLSGDDVAGCAEGSSCDSVLDSKWSEVFGVPVAVTGLLVYLAIVVASFRRGLAPLVGILAVMVIAAAVWFAFVQAFIIRAFCPWCCLTHVLAATGAVLLWWGAGRGAGALSFTGLAPVAFMAVLQFLSDDPVSGAKDASAGAVIVERPTDEPGTIVLHGEFSFPVAEFPALEDPSSADVVVVGVFDYTCDHCVKLLGVMEEVCADSGGRVALVQVPGFFEDNARAVQKLMLSLYRDDPELYQEVAGLVHERAIAPKEGEIRAFLTQMMTGPGLEDMLARHEAGVEAALVQTAEVLKRNEAIVKMRKLPQLMIGKTVVVGVAMEKAYYEKLIEEGMGVGR